MKIDPTVCSILSMKNLDNFSAVEIRTAYIAIKGEQDLLPANARRFVYEELHKIVKRGWLKKATSEKKGITRYTKTKQFDYQFFNSLTEVKLTPKPTSSDVDSFALAMRSRLETYQAELLEGLGSIEEFVSLRTSYPELHASLKPKYRHLKERNHMLMGRIKIVEELLESSRDQ
jgi:hypothetical protein